MVDGRARPRALGALRGILSWRAFAAGGTARAVRRLCRVAEGIAARRCAGAATLLLAGEAARSTGCAGDTDGQAAASRAEFPWGASHFQARRRVKRGAACAGAARASDALHGTARPVAGGP